MKQGTRYFFNEDYFETINSGEKAYWVGLLAADGCISSKNQISLALHIKDLDIIEKFKEALEATHPIDVRNRTRIINGYKFTSQSARLRINSIKTKTDLADKGVIPRKSLILKSPTNVPKEFYSDWIRGYFDGDGSVFASKGNKAKIAITGTKEVLEFIREVIGYSNVVFKVKNKNVYRYKLASKEKIKRFFHILYNNSTIYMERKFNKFKELEVCY